MINIGNTEVINIYIGDTPATAVYIGNTQIWGGGGKDYSTEYFTIEMLSAGTITWNASNVFYSVDEGNTWSAWDNVNGYSANAGDKIMLKSDRTTDYGGSNAQKINSTGNFIIYGNIMSLLYGDNYTGQTTLKGIKKVFRLLLKDNNDKLKSVENLILPATAMTQGCYQGMFENCTAITKPTALPATTLANNCYEQMFAGCTSLTTATELPATTLAYACYSHLFSTTSIVTPPTLPATTLAGECYMGMFYNTPITTAPALPVTTLAYRCYYGMFQSCSGLTSAPELPATTLTEECYRSMFQGCSNLSYIKCLATDISASNCVINFTRDVAASGTFVKDASMSSWTTGANGIPDGWQVQDA